MYLPLVDLGHDVVEFDYDLSETFRYLNPAVESQAKFIQMNRPKVTEALLTQLRAAHRAKPMDLLFTYFTDACIEAWALEEIRGMGIKTVNWYCNGSYLMELVREISPRHDFCLVPEKFRMGDYRALGARPIYCQEAANPAIYKPYEVAADYDVTFVGQAYGERPSLIRYLVEHGIAVHVWGHGWANPDARYYSKETYEAIQAIPAYLRSDPLPDEEMVKMYSRSMINLGFSTCGDTHLGEKRVMQVRLRDFEVPMAGGFYMTEQMEELGDFFDLKKEIVGYGDRKDLLGKIRGFLAYPAAREQIRRAGHARALKDHSWQSRFKAAFAEMGLA